MFDTLPWLPRPSDADKQALASVGGNGVADVARLRKLAGYGWPPAGFRSIGRKLRAVLETAGHPAAEIAGRCALTPFRLLVISSNTSNHLADFIVAAGLNSGLLVTCDFVEYEAPETWLSRAAVGGTPPKYDATLLAFDQKYLHLQTGLGSDDEVQSVIGDALARIDALAVAIRGHTDGAIIVQTLPADPCSSQASIDAWLPGTARFVQDGFNRALAALCREKSLLLFDVAGIANLVGQGNFSAGRYWFIAKYPFAESIAPLYAFRLVQILAAMAGRSRRVLVIDLDNTLWGGIIGDDGVEGIAIGGGTALGEAHLAIQKMVLHYWERGIVVCVASKNTDEIARQAFREHPEMAVKEEHIALFSINWSDKASNIAAMADKLNLGLGAFVFIDDNPAERLQVREALPDVAVPELPKDPSAWLPVFQAAAYFEQVSFSSEDKLRTEFYRGNELRAVQASAHADPAAFLRSLGMVMSVAPFNAMGRARIAQLISKSNQFNLTTRRYNEPAVQELEADPKAVTMQIRLTDTFGDNGMISVVIAREIGRTLEIDTWLMSCRVLGRQVEQVVLNLLMGHAKSRGLDKVAGRYIPTAKNGIVRDHYQNLGFTKVSMSDSGDTVWHCDVAGYVDVDVPIQIADA